MNLSGADSVARHWYCAAAPEVCAADSEAPTDRHFLRRQHHRAGSGAASDCDWSRGPGLKKRLALTSGRNARDDGGVEAFEGDDFAAPRRIRTATGIRVVGPTPPRRCWQCPTEPQSKGCRAYAHTPKR